MHAEGTSVLALTEPRCRPPRGLQSRPSTSDGRAAAVRGTRCEWFCLSLSSYVSWVTVDTECALMGSVPTSSHQQATLQYPIRPCLASLRCYFWSGHLGNQTKYPAWVFAHLSYAGCLSDGIGSGGLCCMEDSFPRASGAQVCGFTPESQVETWMSKESQAHAAHPPLLHRNDFTLWCTRSRSNFICRSRLATIEQTNTLRMMESCTSSSTVSCDIMVKSLHSEIGETWAQVPALTDFLLWP